MKYFKQCQLTKGETSQVAFLYEEYAKLGKTLKLKDDDGWIVSRVGENRISADYLLEWERSYLDQRKASDV